LASSRYAQIPDTAYAVVAEVRAKPGKEAELRAITLPLVAKVRAEHSPTSSGTLFRRRSRKAV
jgi:hypothetical protein